MYICICNAITDTQIRQAAGAGARNLWDLQRELGVAAGCGGCSEHASAILGEYRRTKPVIYQPSTA